MRYFLIMAVVCLWGCAPHRISLQEVAPLGIVGGAEVSPVDPLGETTVMILVLSAKTDVLSPSRIASEILANLDPAFAAKEVVSHVCTASILADDSLVTAAHCFTGKPQKVLIVFGSSIRTRKELVVRSTTKWQVHPRYLNRGRETYNWADLALIHFKGGLAPKYHAATLLEEESLLRDGAPITVAGFGAFDTQRADDGTGVLRKAELTIANARYAESEILIDERNGQGTCFGDSGGPAYLTVGTQMKLWGVLSRGSGVCDQYSLETNLLKHREWLALTLEALRR